MKLVVGLGNPGIRYAASRHNVGFRIVERFARRHAIDLSSERWGGRFGRGRLAGAEADDVDVAVLQPLDFMNRSGDVVAAAVRYLPVADPVDGLFVAYDDVDLPFGRLRIRPSGSSAGHRGLESIIECLGTDRFPRLRFGIARPAVAMETAEYVLQDFSEQEEREIDGPIDTAAEALGVMILEGVVPAMNRYNGQDPSQA